VFSVSFCRAARWRKALLIPALAGPLLGASPAPGPVTLEQALSEARASNAKLPIPLLDVSIAREKLKEATAERWLKVAVEGDFIYAPPSGYDPVVTNAGEFRLQAVGRQPLYDGGARRAAVARAEAGVDAAAGRYRIEEKDLILEVTSRYAESLAALEEASARRSAISRLESYRTNLKSRQASGQAVAADLIKTEVRLASEEANILEAERRADEARMTLAALMGRAPADPLALVPAPDPDLAAPVEPADWESAPEIAAAAAEARAADAGLASARAEWRPHLALSADVGFWGSDTSRWIPADLKAMDPNATFADRVRRDAGYSFSLIFSWPIFDLGAVRARVAQADLELQQAKQKIVAARSDARANGEKARAAATSLAREIALLRKAVPTARDAYLDAESRYRGGAGTSLEVLDAYSAAVDAMVRLSDAVLRYRIARAVAVRWGQP
jgi:outer membrane protein TolC